VTASVKMHRRWRLGATPNSTMPEVDRDLLDMHVLMDAEEHAQKLLDLRPYSLAEVRGCVSAGWIRQLIRMARRLMEYKQVKRYRDLQRAYERQRREMVRLWKIEVMYEALKEDRRELLSRLDAPA